MKYQRANISPANLIYIVECLSDSELKTGVGRKDMILDKLIENGVNLYTEHRNSIKYKNCQNKDQFCKAFVDIFELCQQGKVPHIYIDAHGDAKKGIQLPSKEYISWENQLSLFERVITITKGELSVFALFCYSMSIRSKLVRHKLPFSFYYGYTNEVTAETIETEGAVLFENLLNPLNNSINITDSLKISCYSEYDNVMDIIACLHSIRNNPSFLSGKIPTLSKNKIFTRVEADLARTGIPLSGVKKLLNTILKSEELVRAILGEYMHDTQRLDELIRSFIGDEKPLET